MKETMAYNLKNLFRLKTENPVETPAMPTGDRLRQSDETYKQYGLRICGQVTAGLHALNPMLTEVYNSERNHQINNEALQEQYKQEIQRNISSVDNSIAVVNAKIEQSDNLLNSKAATLKDLNQRLIEAKNKNGDINKTARVKLIIGTVILAILTVYLFIFYSSTFYSAFFKVFDGDISVGQAIFDAQAIPHAFLDGFGELMFILIAPIIFMGLGYGLHYFSEQKSWTGYLKAGTVLLVTLIFDCILAYSIAQKIYIIYTSTQLGEFEPFSIMMAVSDINVWAVIFCGFIVYLIWGIVFSMAMSAYESLRSNKTEIMQIQQQIEEIRNNITEEKQNKIDHNAKLEQLKIKKQSLEQDFSRNVHFDTQVIHTALSDFFSGWMSMMNALGRPASEQEQANSIYQSTIATLFPKNENG